MCSHGCGRIEFLFVASGNIKWYTAMQNCRAIPQIVRNRITI